MLPRRIFAFWFGDSGMIDIRKVGLESLRNQTGVEIVFLKDKDIQDWILPEAPLHPAFQYLTPIHKADYFRTYLMNFHGGGYSDVKPATGDWNPSFDLLDGDDLFGIGYREVSRIGVATLGVNSKNNKVQLGNPAWWKYRFLQLNYRSLLGNGAYIFKPHTEFTEEWYSQLQTRLDMIFPALKENPGRFPKEKPGKIYNGEVSTYPVPWSYILGDIFHPLCYRYRKRLGYTLPPPVLKRAQVLQLVERSKNSEE